MINEDTLRYLEERNRRIDCAIRNMDKQELLSCFDLNANKNSEYTLAINRHQDKAMNDLNDEHLFDWNEDEDLEDLPRIADIIPKVSIDKLVDISDDTYKNSDFE